MRRFPLAELAIVLSVVMTACNASAASHPALPCSGRVCALSIQNDGSVDIAVRIADTTGREGVLGRVGPRGLRVFKIQWVKSYRLRILILTRDGGLYSAMVPLMAARITEVHFPADFAAVEDEGTGTALFDSGHRVP